MSDANKGTAAPAAATPQPEQSAQKVIDSIPNNKQAAPAADAIDTSNASPDELEELADSEDATPAEQQAAKVELKRRMKFRVNGREVERDIDLNDEKTLQELLQRGMAADERFQSASGIEKKMKDFAALMQADPIKALMAAGHDPDKLTETYMKKRVEELSKSPEQIKLEKLQQELQEERDRRGELEKEKLTAEQSKVEAEYSRQLDEEITTGLSSSDLPKSPYVVKRIAENLMLAIEQGHEDVSVEDVLPLVEKQIKDEIRQMFEAMPEDVIEKTLGDGVSNKLRQRRIAKAKASKTPETAASVKATGQSEINKSKAKEEAPKTSKAKDFFSKF